MLISIWDATQPKFLTWAIWAANSAINTKNISNTQSASGFQHMSRRPQ